MTTNERLENENRQFQADNTELMTAFERVENENQQLRADLQIVQQESERRKQENVDKQSVMEVLEQDRRDQQIAMERLQQDYIIALKKLERQTENKKPLRFLEAKVTKVKLVIIKRISC